MVAVGHLGFAVHVFRITHEEYLVVFTDLQNLVEIHEAVLKICEFNVLRVWLENAYSRPLFGGFFGSCAPKCKRLSLRPSKGTNGCKITSIEPLNVEIALKM